MVFITLLNNFCFTKIAQRAFNRVMIFTIVSLFKNL